jgi:hypothetical protein
MKKTVLPRVHTDGALRKVVFSLVNPDCDRELAAELTGGGPIPQLVMFRKKGDGWVRKKLVGGQSVETVEKFIKEGMAGNKEEDDQALPEASDQDGEKADPTTPSLSKDM